MLEVRRTKIQPGSPEYEKMLREKWTDLHDHLIQGHGMTDAEATATADIDQAIWRARFEPREET